MATSAGPPPLARLGQVFAGALDVLADQPTLLATYPTAASLLADYQRSGRLERESLQQHPVSGKLQRSMASR